MKCFSCPQPYHPSTGHYYAEWDVAICETCYKAFLEWLRGHLHRPWGGELFYEHAATSIRPGIYPEKPYCVFQRYQYRRMPQYFPKGAAKMVPGSRPSRVAPRVR